MNWEPNFFDMAIAEVTKKLTVVGYRGKDKLGTGGEVYTQQVLEEMKA